MVVAHRAQNADFLLLFSLSLLFEQTAAKMKDFEKEAPENTMGGGTAPTAYRRPNGDTPRNAGDPLTLPPESAQRSSRNIPSALPRSWEKRMSL